MLSGLNGVWKLTWKAIDGAPQVPPCEQPIDAQVPGDVHSDLVRAGLLPEPLVGVNAPLHEWVEHAVFIYEREFEIDADFDRAELVCHGVDCLAEVFIDGNLVGSSANAYVPHTFDVTAFVAKGKRHVLRISVETGVKWAKEQDASNYCPCESPERMFLRKPQFVFKWDWAPRLVTCGIWRDVELKLYRNGALRGVMLTPSFDGRAAELTASIEIAAFAAGAYVVKLRVARGASDWEASREIELSEGRSEAQLNVRIDPVNRWYPAGYGDQALYAVEIELEHTGKRIDRWAVNYGFREVTVRQDAIGDSEKSFVINVNGTDIFCKGANWVPTDSMLGHIATERYDRLVAEAADAHFNMLRIWGGGIYEDEVFYDLCDRHGILIWHDFMFACAEYPDDQEWFVSAIRDETAKAIIRLRHHPCIALWCGNNENDWLFGFRQRGKGKRIEPFPGQAIYHRVLPELCSRLDPQRPYWPSSPFGGTDPNCESEGDRHAWNVSILDTDPARRADFRNYRTDRGKFISEYGIVSCALPQTILDYTGEDKVDFASDAYRFHDNPVNTRDTESLNLSDRYLIDAFGSVPKDEQTYILQSLAHQAMAYREAISSFRIRKFDCAGSLFWMYADCWGTIGWTIIDYYLRRKPSFYWVRKAYAPVAVFARAEGETVKSYVVNDTLEELSLKLVLEVGSMRGEGRGVEDEVVVPANGVVQGPDLPCGPGYAFARIETEGRPMSEDLILTRLPSEMKIPKVKVSAKLKRRKDGAKVTLTSDGFAHFVYLDLADGAIPTDNYFNLIPGRPKVVRVKGDVPDSLTVGALNLRK